LTKAIIFKCTHIKRLLLKVIGCLSDTNFLIADKCLVLFKNDTFLKVCFTYKLEDKIIDRLICNMKEHWSEEIGLLSKLAVSRLIAYDKELINKREELKEINLSSLNEELWNFRFDLKAD
jgi:hypothetical protein